MGIGIVGDTQEDITPFQRQVFEAEKARQQREKQKQMDQMKSGNGRSINQLNNSGQHPHAETETVRFVNDGDRSNDDTLEVF